MISELLAQEGGGFRVEPQDDFVVVGVAVGVFDGQLGFADAAHAVEGLDRRAAAAD